VKLVFATGNSHKLAEAQQILGSRIPELTLLPHEGPEPIESGTSFLENALIKARSAYGTTGQPAFADDSGLSVEVMGGAPGIFSAIWSGTRSDPVNRELLLSQLKDIPAEHRQAAFICTIALVEENSETSFTGIWQGSIAFSSTGDGGFGYDPVFIPEGFEVSAAELAPEVKSSFSHRAMAMQQLADFLKSR
jgi:XTP/dITP diphosphohydrolase